MKMLVVGDGHSPIHEVAVAEAFRRLGHVVEVFYWNNYFITNNTFINPWFRAQNKYIWGPLITKINYDLVTKACKFLPDIIFVYRGDKVTPSTLLEIKNKIPECIVIGYNNDDPFGPGHPSYLWRHYLASVPYYDLVLAYRHHNLLQLREVGARRVELLRSWFVPWLNNPVEMTKKDMDNYGCDVVFIGHYEADRRVTLLESVVRSGWKLRLFGPGYDWDPIVRRSRELSSQVPVRMVWGEDYNKALSGARVALCFLSKLNRDTYTRRCFEIPATRALMLSEYTDDLATLFREGEEADFFRNPEELITKIKIYITDDRRRRTVAEAGFNKVYNDGHDVISRMRQVLVWANKTKGYAN